MAELKTIFSADTTGLQAAVGKTQSSIAGLASKLGGMFAAGMAINYVKNLIDAQSAIQDQAESIGVSTRMLQGMREMGKEAGVSFEKIQNAINRIDDARIEAMRDQSGKAAEAFAALGISAKQLAGMTAEQTISAMSEAFSKSGRGARETGAMMDILGNKSRSLLPVFDQLGSEGEAAFKRFEEAGKIAADNVITDMDRLGDRIEGMWSVLGNKVSNILSTWATGIEFLLTTAKYMVSTKGEGKGDMTAIDLAYAQRESAINAEQAKKKSTSAAIVESQKMLVASSAAKFREDTISQTMRQEAKTDALTRIGGGSKEISDNGMMNIATRQLNALERIAAAVTAPEGTPDPAVAQKFIEMKW